MRRRVKTGVIEMITVKEILRLYFEGYSRNQIAKSVNRSRSTVQDYINRAMSKQVSKEVVDNSSESELNELLSKKKSRKKTKAEPDFVKVSKELTKKGVTLALVWQEYSRDNPDGLRYSGFCDSFRKWSKTTEISMANNYKAGEYLFLDYAGHTVPIYDIRKQEVLFKAQIFVSALGASNYIYAEATPSQELEHWLGSQIRAFEYYVGVPEILVPDNLKSAVTSACRYEPEINRTYADFANHYGVAVIPARVRKPQDKAKVENAVQNVERWILAPLRDRRFNSIDELNVAMRPLLEGLNHRVMKGYSISRHALYLETDKPALKPLNANRYKLSTWKKAKVNIDYHVEVLKNYYSVPFRLIGKVVEVRFTEDIVDMFLEGKLIAKHRRCKEGRHVFITNEEHMPEAHKAVAQITPMRLTQQAKAIGENTLKQVEAILGSRPHYEQGYRAVLGVIRLANKYSKERLETACQRANALGVASYKSIASMLKTNSDLVQTQTASTSDVFTRHSNIRGGNYYT